MLDGWGQAIIVLNTNTLSQSEIGVYVTSHKTYFSICYFDIGLKGRIINLSNVFFLNLNSIGSHCAKM